MRGIGFVLLAIVVAGCAERAGIGGEAEAFTLRVASVGRLPDSRGFPVVVEVNGTESAQAVALLFRLGEAAPPTLAAYNGSCGREAVAVPNSVTFTCKGLGLGTYHMRARLHVETESRDYWSEDVVVRLRYWGCGGGRLTDASSNVTGRVGEALARLSATPVDSSDCRIDVRRGSPDEDSPVVPVAFSTSEDCSGAVNELIGPPSGRPLYVCSRDGGWRPGMILRLDLFNLGLGAATSSDRVVLT